VLEKAADQLERLSVQAESQGGLTGALAAPLADDADFLRKVEPSRIAARLRGTPSEPARRTRPAKGAGALDLPLPLVLAAALTAGFLLAKLVEWRSYAAGR
jgi:hypothetical protein